MIEIRHCFVAPVSTGVPTPTEVGATRPSSDRALFQRAKPFSQSFTYSPRSTSFRAFRKGTSRGTSLPFSMTIMVNVPSVAM